MIIDTGTEYERDLRDEVRYGHGKYDSQLTAYLSAVNLAGDPGDESAGSVCDAGYAARYGRRILFTDTQGFVYSWREDNEDLAIRHFASMAAELDWDES